MIEIQYKPRTMTDTPLTTLLNRPLAITAAQEQESKLSLLRDLANFGSNLMPKVFECGGRTLSSAVISFHILREVIIQIDALEVLLTNGCGPATASVCRSLVEKYHLLLWTLKSQPDDKAKYLLVSSCRNDLARAQIAIPGTPENEELAALMGSVPGEIELINGSIHNAKWFQEFLSLPQFSGINQNFETHRAGGKKKRYEECWTVVFCKSTQDQACTGSARSIAVCLGKLEEYIVYYSDYSESTHGSSAQRSVTFSDRGCRVSNIRGMNEFDSVWHLAVNSAIESFLTVVRHYCPDEEQSFSQKYVKDWLGRIEA